MRVPAIGRVRPWLWIPLAVFACAALVTACSHGNATPTASPPLQTFTVTVNADGLSPSQVKMRVPDKARLIVQNDTSDDCVFSFGPYVQRMNVPPHDKSTMAFTAIATQDLPPNLAVEGPITMGCEGGQRTGTIQLLTSTSTH